MLEKSGSEDQLWCVYAGPNTPDVSKKKTKEAGLKKSERTFSNSNEQ